MIYTKVPSFHIQLIKLVYISNKSWIYKTFPFPFSFNNNSFYPICIALTHLFWDPKSDN